MIIWIQADDSVAFGFNTEDGIEGLIYIKDVAQTVKLIILGYAEYKRGVGQQSFSESTKDQKDTC